MKKTTQKPVREVIKSVRQAQQIAESKKTEKELVKRILQLERELSASTKLKNVPTHYKIPHSPNRNSESVAVMVASDWHIEEVVKQNQVSGLNEFNEQICKERVRRFFQHGVKLVQKESRDTKIQTLVLALLGDFISGQIHEELAEGNRLRPVHAIIEVQKHIAGGIQYILDNTKVNLVIPCASGNHGRITSKVHISTEDGNSLERLLYHSLAQQFEGNKRVHFVISDGYHTYVKVWDNFTIRFHHGHAIRYGGGIGGITIPVNKAIAQWNKGRKADIEVFGHFHQLFDGGNFICNGSLIGYNAFALSIKASPERPQQAFFLIDRDCGKTVVAPIILTEDR
jgi:hypothetical protein